MVLRVAVIGAGAAGLAALRRLAARPSLFEAVAMEQSPSVGGTWVYTERVGRDERGLPVHASMYANLRTNLPKEVMAYPGFPFPESLPSYVTHQQVNQYLSDFTDHFKLRDLIRLNTIVENVRPLTSRPCDRWEVTSRGVEESEAKVETYDAVIVCNGHYSVPLMPDLPGQETFTGRIQHSHDYRHPEDFTGQRVVCLGAASSGQDISLDLVPHAKQVYLCHKKPLLESSLPHNLTQKPGIESLWKSTVHLEGGEVLHDIDALVVCTGYKYSFPFLSDECGVKLERGRVFNTYKHVIHTPNSSLFFVGLCLACYPNFDCQAQFVVAALDGSLVLPSREDMEEDIESDQQWRRDLGWPSHHAHFLLEQQWIDNDTLAELAKFEPVTPILRKLYLYVWQQRKTKLLDYRKQNFRITGPDSFCDLPNKQ